MSTLFWNCRGLGDPATVHELRDLAQESRPSILCVAETQIAKYRVEGLSRSLGFDHAYGVDSSGRSGGLCIYWKDPLVMTLHNFSKYHIDMTVVEPGKDPWRLTVWYGEANRALRFHTWDMMRFLKADCDLPWMNIGDFNEVLRRYVPAL
jgi:exonuclease III